MADGDIDVLGVEMSRDDLTLLNAWLAQDEAKLFKRIIGARADFARLAACNTNPQQGVSYEYHIMQSIQHAAQSVAYDNVLHMPEIIDEIAKEHAPQEKP